MRSNSVPFGKIGHCVSPFSAKRHEKSEDSWQQQSGVLALSILARSPIKMAQLYYYMVHSKEYMVWQ